MVPIPFVLRHVAEELKAGPEFATILRQLLEESHALAMTLTQLPVRHKTVQVPG